MGERSTTTAKNAGRRGFVGRIVNIALFMLAGMVSGVVIMRVCQENIFDVTRGDMILSQLFAELRKFLQAAYVLQHQYGNRTHPCSLKS